MSKKDSIDYFSDDKQKQLLAIMNKMMSMNMNNNISFDNNSKTKKLEELKEKVEKYEEENKNLYNQFIDKENIYIDKIKTLERKMLTSEKADAIFLQKQNKEYELTINNLNRNIRKISSENESESIRFKSMIGELMMLKDQLAEEISAMELLNGQINAVNATKPQAKSNKKVELVVKYNDIANETHTKELKTVVSQKEFEDPNAEIVLNNYQVRRTTRTEFDMAFNRKKNN
jgi:hypothetical protein